MVRTQSGHAFFMENRKIIHIDMDAFYASVEQRDFPELRGKPIAVGGGSERGVVAAASYEARKFGVCSAMSSRLAKQKCPQLIFVKPRFEVYKYVSEQIREIFLSYTPLVEPLSLDEAYLDVTSNLQNKTTATEIAQEIKAKIFEKTALTASAGVSYNKFLAKIASDYKKPNGIFIIKPSAGEAFVEQMEVSEFHGIGRVTAERMKNMGIMTGNDLKTKSLEFLTRNFGKTGAYYFNICRGIDNRMVNPDGIRKSIGVENTFFNDLVEPDALYHELANLTDQLWRRAARSKAHGKTISLKVKFADFEVITRSRTSQTAIVHEEYCSKLIFEMINQLMPFSKGVRLLGVTLSNLLFEDEMVGQQLTFNF